MHQSRSKRYTLPLRKSLATSLAIALGMSLGTPATQAMDRSLAGVESKAAAQPISPTWFDPARIRVTEGSQPDLDLVEAINSGQIDIHAQWQQMMLARARHAGESSPSGITHTVSNCDDSGAGSLRAAVDGAASGDTVDLSGLTCSTISLAAPVLTYLDELTLIGAENDNPKYLTSIQPTTDNNLGLIHHAGSETLTVENLQLQQGRKYMNSSSDIGGGCIHSQGSVTMSGSVAKYCTAKNDGSGSALGGGIYAKNGVALFSSVITGNKAISENHQALGGGISTPGSLLSKYSTIGNNEAESTVVASDGGGVFAQGESTILRSTVSGNKAFITGGAALSSPSGNIITIDHSTISGNVSTGDGYAGGVYIHTNSVVNIANSTFTRNVARIDSGAGLTIKGDPASISLNSNIISGNWFRSGSGSSVEDLIADFHASAATSGSGNLVGWITGGSAPPAGTIKQHTSPLGPLASNGGATSTHLPLTGSWAMNRGHFTPGIFDPDTDQSGAPRRVGAGVDIGAVESDALFVDGFNKPPLH